MKRMHERGMTIIELLVAMVIGSFLMVAVLVVLSGQLLNDGKTHQNGAEGSRRTLASAADLDQASAIATFQLDKWIRSAGTGFSQTVDSPRTYSFAFGCKLYASKGGTQLLPTTNTSALPKPFDGSNGATFAPSANAGVFRLIPALILPNATSPDPTHSGGGSSDVLVLMSSGNGYGEVPLPFTAVAAAAQLKVNNTTPFSGANANNMALIADTQPDAGSGGSAKCMVTQAALTTTTGAATALPLAGSWWASTIDDAKITDYSDTGVVLDLGDPTNSLQPPSFLVVGVGDNDTLYSYDLLKVSSPQLLARGQNVFELHALYGVDTVGDGKSITWVSPSTGTYASANLTDGSINASKLIKTIRALRVGLIMRTDQPERDAVSTSVTLFSDTSSSFTRTFGTGETNYRYRTVEVTVPLRNNFF